MRCFFLSRPCELTFASFDELAKLLWREIQLNQVDKNRILYHLITLTWRKTNQADPDQCALAQYSLVLLLTRCAGNAYQCVELEEEEAAGWVV